MKKITITNAEQAIDEGNKENPKLTNFIIEGGEEMDASDGYHTFTELYDHRITLYMKLCQFVKYANFLEIANNPYTPVVQVWCSKKHHDNSEYEGWFIMGINKEKGEQISYHLPMREWEEAIIFCEVLENAPEFDGHGSSDVITRIKTLI